MATISPDDVCGVCDETRENHGDKNHQFDLEGNLKPLAKEPVNNLPGRPMPKDPVPATILRLVERLIAKGLLEGDDLIYIFGGVENGKTNRGSVGNFATGANQDATPQ